MIDETAIRARGDELCLCGHERGWHDSCSKCDCPWFISPDNKAAFRRWNADRKKRRATEPDGKKLPKADGARG